MHLPMTSIQDAWGVRTLDDRSDTTIPSRCHPKQLPHNAPQQQQTAIVPTQHDPVPMMLEKRTRLYPNNGYANERSTDESQLLGLLTLLMIFILIDKLVSIWNKS